MSDWQGSGQQMVYRILIKRRRKCQAEGKHNSRVDSWGNVHACQACGVVG